MAFCPNINGILAHWKQSFLENVLQHQDVQFLRLHVKVTCGQRRATVLLFVDFWLANIPTRCKVQGSYAYCSGMHWHRFFKTFFLCVFSCGLGYFSKWKYKIPIKNITVYSPNFQITQFSMNYDLHWLFIMFNNTRKWVSASRFTVYVIQFVIQ